MSNESPMARRFGASVRLERGQRADRQLFLIRFPAASSQAAGRVKARGGKVVLAGRGWMLAELGFSPAMSLDKEPGIHSVRGVSIDPERLEFFRRAVEGAVSAERRSPAE